MAWISLVLATALVVVGGLWWRARAETLEARAQLRDSQGTDDQATEISVDRLSAALDETSSAVVVVDADGETVFSNAAARQFADARHGDALIKQSLTERLDFALRGAATRGSIKLAGPPASRIETTGRPLVLNGALIGAVALVDDVSEQKRISDLRRDFVANVSHELKTPVGALSLLAETLAGENDPEVVLRFAGRIHDEANRLDQLINDLLDLSRVEAGSEFALERLDVREVLDEAAALVRPSASQRSIALDVDLGSPAVVEGDRSQLVSAVRNLLENAVKYSPPGGEVTVAVSTRLDEAQVTVSDSGCGIPADGLDRIFERFYRVDQARSTDTGGTGLGLSIVRNIVQNHGGRVEVESQEGVGSTFTLTLPRSEPTP